MRCDSDGDRDSDGDGDGDGGGVDDPPGDTHGRHLLGDERQYGAYVRIVHMHERGWTAILKQRPSGVHGARDEVIVESNPTRE